MRKRKRSSAGERRLDLPPVGAVETSSPWGVLWPGELWDTACFSFRWRYPGGCGALCPTGGPGCFAAGPGFTGCSLLVEQDSFDVPLAKPMAARERSESAQSVGADASIRPLPGHRRLPGQRQRGQKDGVSGTSPSLLLDRQPRKRRIETAGVDRAR